MKSRTIRWLASCTAALLALTAAGSSAIAQASTAGSFQPADAATPGCDRACLMKVADQYMDAMVKHDASTLKFAANALVTENLKAIQPGKGIFLHLRRFEYPRQFIVDTETGQIGVQAVIEDFVGPAVLALRLKVQDGAIAEAEMLLTHDGEGGPAFEPQGFLLREGPYIEPIPVQARTSRSSLLEAASAYWTVATSSHDKTKVPFGLGCVHLENGMNTDWEHHLGPEVDHVAGFAPEPDGRRFTCGTDLILSTTFFTRLRDYHTLVDQERGLVMVWNLVDTDNSRAPFQPVSSPAEAGERFADRLHNDGAGFGPDDVPPGLTMRGMVRPAASTRTIYHAETELIVGGKIYRQQQFLHDMPSDFAAAGAK